MELNVVNSFKTNAEKQIDKKYASSSNSFGMTPIT